MALNDLILLSGERLPHCRAEIDKHFHDYASLQYMARGEVVLWYDSQSYRLKGQGFWSAFPGPRIRFHAARPGRSWNHRYITFKGPLVHRWQEAGLLSSEPSPVSPGDWAERFDGMLDLAFRGDRWGTLRAINTLEAILLELAEARSSRQIEEESWLVQVRETLSRSETDSPDYSALAEQVNMAPSTLRRKFRQATGTSLHRYALEARLATACRWLTETDQPLKKIAHRLGYRDVYFFNRQFHRFLGLPPGKFRRTRQR